MNWLEARFRRKFEPRGDGFLFRQVDREVIFDHEDVELLVADWRRYWFSPILWSAFLVFGVALPWAMGMGSIPENYYAIVVLLVCLTIVTCLACLWVSAHGPADAAFKLESVGPGHGRGYYWPDVFWVGICAFQLATVRDAGLIGRWGYLLWGAALLWALINLGRTLWKRRLARG